MDLKLADAPDVSSNLGPLLGCRIQVSMPDLGRSRRFWVTAATRWRRRPVQAMETFLV